LKKIVITRRSPNRKDTTVTLLGVCQFHVSTEKREETNISKRNAMLITAMVDMAKLPSFGFDIRRSEGDSRIVFVGALRDEIMDDFELALGKVLVA
jgi:hypothetical protein